MKALIARLVLLYFKKRFLKVEVWDSFDKDCFNKSLPELLRMYPQKHPVELEFLKNEMAQKFAWYLQDQVSHNET